MWGLLPVLVNSCSDKSQEQNAISYVPRGVHAVHGGGGGGGVYRAHGLLLLYDNICCHSWLRAQ